MRDLADELLQAKVKARLFGGDHAPRLGRLVILDRLGAGAMGTVYTAYDPRLERRVAVKVLHAAGTDDNARFLREARTLAKLAHPNVIAIHDADEHDGAVYIVMELATGVPLRAWIAGEHAIARDWRDLVRVMREIAAGLAAAHRVGLVHRDVKPDNILVGTDRARLVDFGLASDPSELDGAAGTPSYMAPEVLAGSPATPTSDQFSFGVTLFEALHGERPHTGTTRAELREAALVAAKASTRRLRSSTAARALARTSEPSADAAEPVEPPSAVRKSDKPPVPAWVNAIVRRTLAADPAERFASMDAVAAELGRDRIRKRRVVAAVAVAVALGGGIGALVSRSQASAPAVSCSGAERRQAVWSEASAARIRDRLGDAPWSARATSSLERVAGRWEASFATVCEATRVRGEQSDRLLELRMRCLDRALDRFGALVTALSSPLDTIGRAEATTAALQLPSPELCEALVDDAELALPADPASRAAALAIEHDLDDAWAAYALGRYRQARAQVTEIEARTAKLDAPAQRAAVLVLAGSIEARIGEPAKARALLDRALVATAAAHTSELELVVWSRLLRLELFAGIPARAIEWSGFARAAAARTGRDGAELDGIVAEAMRKAGQLGPAREHVQRALASRDPQSGDQRALLEMNLGSIELAAGKSVLAEAAFRRAIDATREVLGDGHPTLGVYLDKLAHAAVARGRIREALALHEQSLALRRRAFGDNDRAIATARLYGAETLLEAGQVERARTELDAARALRARLLGERSPRLGEIDAALGDVAAARGAFDEARLRYDRAAAADPRLDLDARRLALLGQARTPLEPAAAGELEPFSVERVSAIAGRIARTPRDRARPLADALLARWRAAGPVDAALSLPVADALLAMGDRASASTVYTAAITALADEPSRTRLRALRGLATTLDGDAAIAAATAARAMAGAMPELESP